MTRKSTPNPQDQILRNPLMAEELNRLSELIGYPMVVQEAEGLRLTEVGANVLAADLAGK